MRRFVPIALMTCLVAGMSAVGAAARLKSFTVLAVDTSQTNAGGTQNLFEGKRKVGHDSYYCLPGKGGQYCRVTFVLKRGRIDVAGAPTSAKNFTWKIVGGTGIYHGAKGKAKVHDITAHRQTVAFIFT
jgi:hypothetical protein